MFFQPAEIGGIRREIGRIRREIGGIWREIGGIWRTTFFTSVVSTFMRSICLVAARWL